MQLRHGAPLAESGAVGRRKAFGVLATLFLSAALASLALAQDTVIEGKRVALLIGNSKYRHAGGLNNPANDVRAMAGALRSVGFDVLAHEDLDCGRCSGPSPTSPSACSGAVSASSITRATRSRCPG